MLHQELDITDEQRTNLEKLSEHLLQPGIKDTFDMTTYVKGGGTPCNHDHAGVADAIGHGPRAGIEPLFGEEWMQYVERCFTGIDPDWCMFNFLFGQEWAEFDNTPEGAAARIYYVLDNGCPWLGSEFLFLPEQVTELVSLYKTVC